MRFSLLLALPAFLLPAVAAPAQEVTPRAAPAVQEPAEEAPLVEERATDLLFPSWIDFGKGEKRLRQHLVGLGVRKKTFFRVKVYAFGLYLDAAGAAAKLKPLLGRKMRVMMKDRKLDAALLDDSFGKSIRLAMARTVDADDMAEAFEDSLKPRIKKFTATQDEKQQQVAFQALETFRGYFSEPAKEKQVLVFTWLPGGRLLTSIDGKDKPEIKSLALCHALFHVYVGDDPISESGKEAILEGLPAALEQAKGASQKKGE